MRRIRILLKIAVVFGFIGLAGGLSWFVLDSRAPEGAGQGITVFEIEKGRSVRAVADALKERGLIRKTAPFLLRYKLFHKSEKLKAGEYALPSGGGTKAILATLLRGKIYLHPVTVPEGLTAAETFGLFLADAFGTPETFEAAFKDTAAIALLDPAAPDLEGYLFPETYRLPKEATAAEILSSMTSQFKDVFGPEERKQAADIGLTPRQAVTLASLIEKETGRAEEKPLVSAVFHNRLRLGMKLDCDPTVIYALQRDGILSRALRSRDLRYDSPYNTYMVKGLPPGPICSPGRVSLEAALRPAPADFLYFVAKREGGHVFSRTIKEHLAAVRVWRQK
ncbi:MAG: endolytic transglycosylase MltG [Candidatus Aminicenantales bacterium]